MTTLDKPSQTELLYEIAEMMESFGEKVEAGVDVLVTGSELIAGKESSRDIFCTVAATASCLASPTSSIPIRSEKVMNVPVRLFHSLLQLLSSQLQDPEMAPHKKARSILILAQTARDMNRTLS